MTEETTPLETALAGQDAQPAPEQAQPVAEEPKPEAKGGADDDGQIKVPLAALHEVRDANRALKQEMEALKATAQPAKEPEKVPDMFGDPEGYAAWQQRQMESAVGNVVNHFENRILNMSEANASARHGVDVVQKAKEWALSQPGTVQAEIASHADPFEYAVQQHQKVTLTEQFSDPEVMKKFQEFLAGGKPEQAKPAPPTNTAVDQSVGARQAQWAGPTSLDDIFTN